MVILTYVVRTIMVLAIAPMSMLMYAIVKDVMSWGKE